ncbi:WbuC family cupin fold metalloprotein [Geomesophilobacter sediminis]|uniref:WbuC family cupin fold metalloprotein n=1 Tax=Geomesophilobacter sediminis TaxID=2798584 RepID=A0A8J7SDM5_9BACT|nr:WbuC family cupin fold metalloprotein [Geomesophilobacter sediminis]MBJ6727904.1 WbuC family cupin fold metalloprotein [Geomesophilobacter sediminis]
MEIIDQELLDRLSEQARLAPRLRKNHNLHTADDSRCHRLLNAIEPDSYIRPHRHLSQDKDEAFVLLRGTLGVVTFNDEGEIMESVKLTAGRGAVAADIRHGVFHSAVSLEPGTVFFEAKAGPYQPLAPQELAPWAPEEGFHEGRVYLEKLRALFT